MMKESSSDARMSRYLTGVVDNCTDEIEGIKTISDALSVLPKVSEKLSNIVESIQNASVKDWTMDVSTSFYDFFKGFVKSFISMTDTLVGSGKDDELSGFSSIVDELETDYDCLHQKLTYRIFDGNDEDTVSVLWDERKEEDKKKCLKVYEELSKSIEDLIKYFKKKNSVSEESSASVLGPMLPQVPVSGVIRRGENDMKIPDLLIEYVYDPEMKHDLMVEGAFDKFANEITSKHANEVSTNHLSGKVKKLTIERAMLKVKIQWIRLLPVKDKQTKLKAYRARLVDVEKALRKIANSISNVADKKKLEDEMKKIDTAVTKETKRRIRNKQITESVNALITEYKEAGLVPECMELIEESTLFNPDLDVFEEGVNRDLRKKIKRLYKESKENAKKARKYLNEESYSEAAKYLSIIKENVDEIRSELSKFPKDSWTVQMNGMFYSAFRDFILMIPVNILTSFLSELISGGKYRVTVFKIPRWNGTYKDALDKYKELSTDYEILIKEVRKMKKGDVKKESAGETEFRLPENAEFMKECASLVNEGVLDLDDYVDFITEAKKPDDGIMDILRILNSKGYKTKYSCTGHKKTWARDRNGDGIINGELCSSARIVFDKDYNFPDAPKHWGWKNVDGKDYLYVLPKSFSGTTEQNQKAFDAWKNKYMESLRTWVNNLPNVTETKEVITKDNPDKGKDVTESTIVEKTDFTPFRDYRTIDDMIDDELSMVAFECEAGPNPMIYEDSENFLEELDEFYESGNVKLAKTLYTCKRDGKVAIVKAQQRLKALDFKSAREQLDIAKDRLQTLRKGVDDYKSDSFFVNAIGILVGMIVSYVDEGLGGLIQQIMTQFGDFLTVGPIAALGINPRTLVQNARDIDYTYQMIKADSEGSLKKFLAMNSKEAKEEEKEMTPAEKKKKDNFLSSVNTLYLRAINAANDIEICIDKLNTSIDKIEKEYAKYKFKRGFHHAKAALDSVLPKKK